MSNAHGRTYIVRGHDGTEQPLTLADLLSQVRAFCAHTTDLYERDVAKRDGLRKRRGKPRRRPVLADPAARLKKLALETGYDSRRDVFLAAPLEPWTCKTPNSMRFYAELMRGSDGAMLIADADAVQLDALQWMREEELISFGEDGQVHALGDAVQGDRRRYPGSPVPDKRAGIGRQLRDHARKLVFAAWVNIVRRKTRKRLSPAKRASMDRPHGVCIAAYDIAAEANAIKTKRRELDEYRYVSVDTCRRVIRGLLKAGILREAEPPRPIRIKRSWHTVPRVFEVPPELTAPQKVGKSNGRIATR